MWALRFKPVRADEPVRLRLLVLSRNLTRDRSWDIALTLDGVVAKRPQALNRPLVDFIRRLPDLATAGLPDGARALAEEIADDVRRTDWSLPDPFESVSFAVNGLGGKPWRPEPCVRLGVISPFCDDKALSMLADLAGANRPILIGRSDELALVPVATLDRFSRVAVLDEMAATEDGEETGADGPAGPARQGIHRGERLGHGDHGRLRQRDATRPPVRKQRRALRHLDRQAFARRQRRGDLGREGIRPAHTPLRAR